MAVETKDSHNPGHSRTGLSKGTNDMAKKLFNHTKKKVTRSTTPGGPNGVRGPGGLMSPVGPAKSPAAAHPQNVQPTTISMTKSKKPPSYSTQGIINDAVSGISRMPAKPKPKPKAKAPAINSPYGPKTSGPQNAPPRTPPPGPLVGPPAPTGQDKARAASKAKAATLQKKKEDARESRKGKYGKGGGGTRRVGPGDQSTPGRGGSR